MRKRKQKVMPKIDGRVVKSHFEYEIWLKLKDILPKGASIENEVDKIPYVIEHVYIPDFTITLPDGRKLFIETKGNGRQFDGNVRQKMDAVRDQNPELDLRIIFFADGRIGGSKRRKSGEYYRQSDWAKKNRFIFTIRQAISDWFE